MLNLLLENIKNVVGENVSVSMKQDKLQGICDFSLKVETHMYRNGAKTDDNKHLDNTPSVNTKELQLIKMYAKILNEKTDFTARVGSLLSIGGKVNGTVIKLDLGTAFSHGKHMLDIEMIKSLLHFGEKATSSFKVTYQTEIDFSNLDKPIETVIDTFVIEYDFNSKKLFSITENDKKLDIKKVKKFSSVKLNQVVVEFAKIGLQSQFIDFLKGQELATFEKKEVDLPIEIEKLEKEVLKEKMQALDDDAKKEDNQENN